MEYYAGIDVSLEQSSVCVGQGCVRSQVGELEVLARFFGQLGMLLTRIEPGAGPLSQWLHAD